MRIIISLTLLAFSQARVIEPDCDLIPIHNIKYEKEVLKDSIKYPYQMAIDYDTNTLFFSYSVDSSGNGGEIFRSAYINLKTNEFNIINGISDGFAAAVDKNNLKVYLGGRDGVYEFDRATNKANHIDGNGHNIWQMFFKDRLYYTTYPEENAYTFKDGTSTLVPELMDTKVLLIGADSNGNLFFRNSSGLYCYKKAQSEITNLGDYNLNSLTADMNNNVFFSTPNGFYNIDQDLHVNELAKVNNVYGLVIEGDNNFIYASEYSIIRLKPTKKTCLSNEINLLDDNNI